MSGYAGWQEIGHFPDSTHCLNRSIFLLWEALSFPLPASTVVLKISLIEPVHLCELWEVFSLMTFIGFLGGCAEKGGCRGSQLREMKSKKKAP